PARDHARRRLADRRTIEAAADALGELRHPLLAEARVGAQGAALGAAIAALHAGRQHVEQLARRRLWMDAQQIGRAHVMSPCWLRKVDFGAVGRHGGCGGAVMETGRSGRRAGTRARPPPAARAIYGCPAPRAWPGRSRLPAD